MENGQKTISGLDKSNKKQKFKRVARLVEIISFRVFGIRGRRADTGREKLYNWAKDFNGHFEQLFNSLKQFVDDYCNNNEFDRYLSSSNFYHDVGSNDRLYIFWKYENYLRAKEQPIYEEMPYVEFINRDSRTKFSIEHIIPQNLKESKVIEKGSRSILPRITQKFQKEFLHSIGNLTIDPLSANISKSNHSFKFKDQNYFRKVPLKTQNELSDFLNQEKGRWDTISIEKRKKRF